MAIIPRNWTKEEAAAVKAALPTKLKYLVDLLPLSVHACYDCCFYDAGHCKKAGREIPIHKRGDQYDCYQPVELELF